MTDVAFYHLIQTDVFDAVPNLLRRTLEQDHRAVIRLVDAAAVSSLDTQLWRIENPPWLPHGCAPSKYPALQPIWLTQGCDNPNDATYLFVIGSASFDGYSHYERVFYLFRDDDALALTQARERWKAVASDGHQMTYWQQKERGWIQKRAVASRGKG